VKAYNKAGVAVVAAPRKAVRVCFGPMREEQSHIECAGEKDPRIS